MYVQENFKFSFDMSLRFQKKIVCTDQISEFIIMPKEKRKRSMKNICPTKAFFLRIDEYLKFIVRN